MNLLRISYGAVRGANGNSELPAEMGAGSLPSLLLGNQLALQEGNSTRI